MENNFKNPKNLEELCEALKDKGEKTFIIAGGTDLTIVFNKEKIYNMDIIDISKVDELKKIEIDDETIRLGTGLTMTEISRNEHIRLNIPALGMAASKVGSTQIRNRATIGGNIANAAQCGDTIPVLFAYDARLKIINSLGEYRYERVRDFVLGINETTLKEDEAIIEIEVKKSNSVSSFGKVGSRKTVTIAKLNCCGKFDLDENKNIKDLEIYMGAVGVKPVKATLLEEKLRGRNIEVLDEEIKNTIEKQIEEIIPNRSSKYYKKVAAIGVYQDMVDNLRR